MNKNRVTMKAMFIIFLTQLSILSMAQSSKLKTGEWLLNWYLAGPFPLVESSNENKHLPGFDNDFLHQCGGEANLQIKDGQVVRYKGISTRWKKYESTNSIINLDAAITDKSFVTAYAYTEIESETDGIYVLSLGTDDGGQLWFNGEQVWDYAEARAVSPDDDFVPVKVRKGKNTILLKIEERKAAWGFSARFLSFNMNEFLAQQPMFHVQTKNDGISELRFLQNATASEKLFKSVNLEIVDKKNRNTIWQKEWKQEQKMILPVGSNEYKANRLIITATLKDGNLWKKEIPFNSGIPIHYQLFDNGNTNYTIILAKESSESEKWAANELQHWLNQISGVTMPIKTDEEEISEHEIIIGYNKHSLPLLEPGTKKPADTDESYCYKNIGPTILFLGGEKRGSMYSVFSFLENEMGCRWYTPDVSVIPAKTSYSFHLLNHSETPSIKVRNDFYYEAFDPIWAARNKINGAMNSRKQIGGVEGYWSVHTFNTFMPPSEFFETHPEYYSMIDGKRTSTEAQLCLTNPDVLDIITERLKKVMIDEPECLIYSVSQNDCRNPCQCEKCQAIAKKEQSEAGPIIWFVNQVAERIKDEFPGKYVGTLAYQYTRKPPLSIKPLENVVVRFCSIECCFAHDFETCPENEKFLDDLKGWASIAPHVYIWDYVVSFNEYISPFPNFKVLQPNIKTFRDNKAIGIMEQAAYQSRGGEFAELRAYLIAKLLWNAEIDTDEIINDFMSGYYGRSGQYIRSYFDLLQNQVTAKTHIHINLKHDDNIFTEEFIMNAEKIFDQAERVADNDEILHRVEMARLPIMYLKCTRNPVEARINGTYNRFCQIVKREGITHFSEKGEPQVELFHQNVMNAE